MQAPQHATLWAQVDGWDILQDEDDDGDVRKSSWFAVKGDDSRMIDISPYGQPCLEVIVAFVVLDFPDRTSFGNIGPITPDQILARYWRERALEAEARIRVLAA